MVWIHSNLIYINYSGTHDHIKCLWLNTIGNEILSVQEISAKCFFDCKVKGVKIVGFKLQCKQMNLEGMKYLYSNSVTVIYLWKVSNI